MRPVPTHQSTNLTNASEKIKATIDVANMAHIMSHLSNLYPDPIPAVTREYSTNAFDSHLLAAERAGVDVSTMRPIEITLPSRAHSFFEVQDFGVGLDIDEFRKTYLSYGASDKRDSETQNGTLGFGSKSGTTYAPQGWQVTAVKDGNKVLASIALDDEGVPEMDVLWTGVTDESNGVKISIPVKEGDARRFRLAAYELFRYWRPGTVALFEDGEPQELISIFEDESVTWVDDDVALTSGESSIVMNNVSYPSPRTTGWGYGVVAFVPSASVHFTPARDALHLTDTTTDTLDALFDYVDTRAEEMITRYITDGVTPWDRLERFHQMRQRSNYQNQAKVERIARSLVPKEWIDLPAPWHRFGPSAARNQVSTQSRISHQSFRGPGPGKSVVVNHPNYTLTPKSRYSIRQWARSIDSYYNHVYVLPCGIDQIPFLDGCPDLNVIEFKDVVARFPKPKPVRGASKKTEYDLTLPDGATKRTSEIDLADGPLVFVVSYSSLSLIRRQLPGHQVVNLARINQVDKFKRLFPTARRAHEVIAEKREKIAEKLTSVHADWLYGRSWAKFEEVVKDIEDPELVAMIKLVAKPEPEILQRAKTLDVPMPGRSENAEALDAKYPLVDLMYDYQVSEHQNHLVLYMNAVYRDIEMNTLFDSIDQEVDEDVKVD